MCDQFPDHQNLVRSYHGSHVQQVVNNDAVTWRVGLYGHSRSKGELYKGGAQNATVCKFRFCSTVEVGKMYYSVGWLLKIMSTSRIHGIHQMHVVG